MTFVEHRQQAAALGAKEPEMVRLLRVWDDLSSEQKEDLVYLAQSMANRNRRSRRSQKTFGKAA